MDSKSRGFDRYRSIFFTSAYKGLSIFPGYDANLPTQLWTAARYLESLSLLIVPVFFTCTSRTKAVVASYSGIVIA